MLKTQTILQAGKQLTAIAAGRAFRGETLKVHPEDVLADPSAQKQGDPATRQAPVAKRGDIQDPGNPNDVDHGDQDPGQEKA